MLVLTRKDQESIQIGDDILIEVLMCKQGICKIGITAPKDINIVRTELTRHKKEKEMNHEASGNC